MSSVLRGCAGTAGVLELRPQTQPPVVKSECSAAFVCAQRPLHLQNERAHLVGRSLVYQASILGSAKTDTVILLLLVGRKRESQ